MIQAVRFRRLQQRHYLPPASALAEYGNISGIPPKGGNIFPYPFQRGNDIIAVSYTHLFRFAPDRCELCWAAGEEEGRAAVALDGGRCQNTLKGGAAMQALMSGAWLSTQKFELTVRYIETCRESKYVFIFDGDSCLLYTSRCV